MKSNSLLPMSPTQESTYGQEESLPCSTCSRESGMSQTHKQIIIEKTEGFYFQVNVGTGLLIMFNIVVQAPGKCFFKSRRLS